MITDYQGLSVSTSSVAEWVHAVKQVEHKRLKRDPFRGITGGFSGGWGFAAQYDNEDYHTDGGNVDEEPEDEQSNGEDLKENHEDADAGTDYKDYDDNLDNQPEDEQSIGEEYDYEYECE